MKQKGSVNLLDLLIVLAIAGLLMGFALPSYHFSQERQQQVAELNRIQGILQQARILASLLNQEIELCPARSNNQCALSRTGEDLLLVNAQGQALHFYSGSGHALSFPEQGVRLRPLPARGAGSTLLPCTGFRYNSPVAITLSSTGRVRLNNSPPAHLQNQCPP